MKFPVLFNYIVPSFKKGKLVNDINRGVFDMHYTNITKIVNGNHSSIVFFVDGSAVEFCVAFEAMYNLYNSQHNIHEEWKEEVDKYKKDNLSNIKDILNSNGIDEEPA